MADDSLSDFERSSFVHDGKERAIFRLGSGPAVIVIAEMPGITPKVADFARRVAGIGCTAVLPHLFGAPGTDPSRAAKGAVGLIRYAMSSIAPACISREFSVLATGRTSPVVAWLRALAAAEHERCGGPGVGAIGMCFTGGFALAMAVDDRLLAPVLAQPSLPFPVSKAHRRSIDISPDDLQVVQDRCAAGLQVLGLRFAGDRLSPPERFQHLREALGDAFVSVELDDSAANPAADLSPHSVVTEHLVDEPGTPTRAALDQVLDLFRTRLLDSTASGGAADG
jgi:dienelactone hydrolase